MLYREDFDFLPFQRFYLHPEVYKALSLFKYKFNIQIKKQLILFLHGNWASSLYLSRKIACSPRPNYLKTNGFITAIEMKAGTVPLNVLESKQIR